MSNTSILAKQNIHVWKKIGEGSFSKVYLTKYGEVVNDKVILMATKIINKNSVSIKFVEKFLPRELDILLKLKHPFIIQVYSVYQYSHKIYINMEYAENGDLFAYLRKSTLTEPQIRLWLSQILWAFMYMHKAGVTHRDLKCENILLTANYNVRITDFGFARFVDRYWNPEVNTVCGSMVYMSPELLSGSLPYNPFAVDAWAIGIVLFMMANNLAPFRNKQKEDIYKKQITKDYSFRKMLNRSESLKELTAMFLEPDPRKRIKIKNAFHSSWMKIDEIETPLNVHVANEMVRNQKRSLEIPIITPNILKESKLYFQVSENVKQISSINEDFFKIDEHEEHTIF